MVAIGAVATVVSLVLAPALSAALDSSKALKKDNSELDPASMLSIDLDDSEPLKQTKVSLKMLGTIGSFTPVTRDVRLARAYAEAVRESQTRHFRFTPTSGSASGERSVTVLVRAANEAGAKRNQPNLGLAPVAYNLGKSKGIDHFTGKDELANKDEDPIVGDVELPTSGFMLKSKPNRFSTNLQVEARAQTATAPTNNAPATLGGEKTYTVDLSSSYALTRNLNVEAGVRYRGPDNRLVPLTDQQQDSQAVYVGTKFKF